MGSVFFTIGHSTRVISEFVDLLAQARIELVVDIRTVPRSRTNPQYNSRELEATLSDFNIGYKHMHALGGLRGRKWKLPPEVNGFWQNQSFHNYADYAMSSEFKRGLAELRELGRAKACALMCAEAVWWRCHRRIIADYLIAGGDAVFHLLGRNDIDPARMSDAARPRPDGTISYPAES
jgi:uncharacterized protein (DUF488 family)